MIVLLKCSNSKDSDLKKNYTPVYSLDISNDFMLAKFIGFSTSCVFDGNIGGTQLDHKLETWFSIFYNDENAFCVSDIFLIKYSFEVWLSICKKCNSNLREKWLFL